MENIFIIVPTLDPDEKIMTKFINELQQEFKHILVVNDGSSVEHKNFFENLEKQGIEIFNHDKNYGKGRAIKNAFNYIINKYPNIIGSITADCDGQHAVRDIKCVAEALLEYQESLILGVRDFEKDNVPFKSRLGNIFAKKMFKLILGVDISDTQTGLRGFGKNLMSKFSNIPGERYEFETNMLVNCDQYDIEIVEIPIETIYINSNAKSHFKPLKDSIVIYHSSIKYLHSILNIKKRRKEKMKQSEAKELLKRLQKDKYIDSKMLNKVLNFSDKVLENLNNIDGNELSYLCQVLTLYNNEEERLEILHLVSTYIGSPYITHLLAILKNKMLRDNKLAIKHAQIFIEYSNGNNENILYKFLTDEFFIKNNLVTTFISKISKLYSDDYINYENILNVIKEKHNDKYIGTYIDLLNEPNKSIASYAYDFIMNNTFGNPEDNILMSKIMTIFRDVLYRDDFKNIVINNKDLLIDILRENEDFFSSMLENEKRFIYRFFKRASNNNFTKEEVNKGIELITKYYIYEYFEEEKLMDVLENRRFKEIDEIVKLEVINSTRDILTIANLDSKIYKGVIDIFKNYPDYINLTLNYLNRAETVLEYAIKVIKQHAKYRECKDIYNCISIFDNHELRLCFLNLKYAELYINENNQLKRDVYYKIMTENKYIEYKEKLINMIKPINNNYLLQIFLKYMETINDEKELLELFKVLTRYNRNEDLEDEEKNKNIATLTESIIEEYDDNVLDENAKDIRNYLLNGLNGINDKQFLKENYDLIYNWLYKGIVSKEYDDINEVKKIIQDRFNITIGTLEEEKERKDTIINNLINSIENKEEVNIRKLSKKNK